MKSEQTAQDRLEMIAFERHCRKMAEDIYISPNLMNIPSPTMEEAIEALTVFTRLTQGQASAVFVNKAIAASMLQYIDGLVAIFAQTARFTDSIVTLIEAGDEKEVSEFLTETFKAMVVRREAGNDTVN